MNNMFSRPYQKKKQEENFVSKLCELRYMHFIFLSDVVYFCHDNEEKHGKWKCSEVYKGINGIMQYIYV